ncbi:40S ribosomal protein S17 [Linnemannia zychae]|nr:40S ribosomal protein S17 [Linnemannia zychae]
MVKPKSTLAARFFDLERSDQAERDQPSAMDLCFDNNDWMGTAEHLTNRKAITIIDLNGFSRNKRLHQCTPNPITGRVRTKTVKRASKVLIEKYYPRLTLDFQTNKKIASEVAIIPSKRLRNKIAGFTTHLMKRIQRGPVRGISFKLQEEERERKDNYIPEFSALDTSAIQIDTDTKALLKSLNFEDLAGVTAVEVKQAPVERKPRGDRPPRA